MKEKPWYDPKTKTPCPLTNRRHAWDWDKDLQDYVCKDCGAFDGLEMELDTGDNDF